MNTKDVLKSLRCCAHNEGCHNCSYIDIISPHCCMKMMEDAADKIDALLDIAADLMGELADREKKEG